MRLKVDFLSCYYHSFLLLFVNPKDFSVFCENKLLDANEILQQMKDDTGFGKNLRKSIRDVTFKLMMNSKGANKTQ
jgi:hypothetical protein